MPRNPWRRILDRPPIDWALLAAERSLKGRKATPAHIAKQKAGLARAKRAKRRKSKATIDALAKARPKRQLTHGAKERFLAAFQPGCWYGLGDLIAASGLKRGTVHGYAAKFHKQGILLRVKNPAFERPGFMEPQWLYQRRALNAQVQHDVDDQGEGAAPAE
jgi:hypothetical protein